MSFVMCEMRFLPLSGKNHDAQKLTYEIEFTHNFNVTHLNAFCSCQFGTVLLYLICCLCVCV